MATRKVKCLVTSVLAALCYLSSTGKSQGYNHCGLRSWNTRSRIIGGIQSRPGMWPWQVAIYKGNDNSDEGKQFICGGALVGSKWVVTTAHCFFKISETSSRIRYEDDSSRPNKYTVVAGDYNIFSKDKTEQKRQVFKIHIYPGYRHSPFYENDIALIELNRTVTLGPSIRTICLPDADEKLSIPGVIAMVAGWGKTQTSIRSQVIRHSAYQIQNDDLCDQATIYFFNRSATFCAGNGKGGNDTCQGDSGGSLVRQVLHKGELRWVTVGLVSWGEGCGIKGKYGYYTRMEPFVPWIQNKLTLAVTCGNPGKIPNGRFTGKDFTAGSRVKYKCKRGYNLKGRSRRKCKKDGKWSKAPVCQKVYCQKLSNPRNGSQKPAKKRYSYRDKVRFLCKTNFTRMGKAVIVCRHDATWSSFQAVCLDPCPDPGIPKGGSRLDHSFKHNDIVRFACRKGWNTKGVRTIRCIKGRWNRSPPKCTISGQMCSRPRTPNNGQIQAVKSKNVYSNKDLVTFYCGLGYKLVGNENTMCVDGKWTTDPPTCKRMCGNPGIPANGGFTGSSFFDGREIRFHCYSNFDLIGSQTARCLSTGRWTERRPECKSSCINPVITFNGTKSNPPLIRGQRTKHNTNIRFRCRPRYTLVGRQTILCDDGRWNAAIPVCKVPCSNPGFPVKGYKRNADYRHGKRVGYACQRGTRLVGESSLICNNGVWSSAVPLCLGGCVVPNTFAGVNASPRALPGEMLQHNSRITFSCFNNKTLNGSKETACDNGNWNAFFPTCEVSTTHCPNPGVPKNSFITSLPVATFTDGTIITFTCNDTYISQGQQTIECQNGKWSYDIPKCLAPCQDPGTPKDGIRYDNAFKHDDRVRFACRSGKTIKGEAIIRCKDGEWDHHPPKCLGTIQTVCHSFLPWSDIFCSGRKL